MDPIDPLALAEVLETLLAVGPVRRFKGFGLEVEFVDPPAAADTSTPSVRRPRETEQVPSGDPYDLIFRGQKPVFPKFPAE